MPAAPIVQQDAVQQGAPTSEVLKDVIASLARKQRRLFHHTWELLPDLQHMLLIGSKYTRQFQIALLRRVAWQEADRMEMASLSSATCHYALGGRAASSTEQFFYHDSQQVQNLMARLRILVWTNGCLERLCLQEFFLGDDFNSSDAGYLHSGGKQHLTKVSVTHADLEVLLQRNLSADQLRHQGRLVLFTQDINPAWFCPHQRDNGQMIGPLVALPRHLQIVLLDFRKKGWSTVNRVYVKPDLVKNAMTTKPCVDVKDTMQTALNKYMVHFRAMATDGTANRPDEHYVSLWIAAYDLENNTASRLDPER